MTSFSKTTLVPFSFSTTSSTFRTLISNNWNSLLISVTVSYRTWRRRTLVKPTLLSSVCRSTFLSLIWCLRREWSAFLQLLRSRTSTGSCLSIFYRKLKSTIENTLKLERRHFFITTTTSILLTLKLFIRLLETILKNIFIIVI